MNPISSLVRIVVGIAILVFTYISYQRTFSGVAEGGKVTLFGSETGASPEMLTLGFGVVGIVGVVLVGLGILGLLKPRS